MEKRKEADFLFLGSKITVDSNCSHKIEKHLFFGRKAIRNLDNVLESRDITLLKKFCIVKIDFSNSHVWMWELAHKEGWAQNLCFQIVLEKTSESLLNGKIEPVNPHSLNGHGFKQTPGDSGQRSLEFTSSQSQRDLVMRKPCL